MLPPCNRSLRKVLDLCIEQKPHFPDNRNPYKDFPRAFIASPELFFLCPADTLAALESAMLVRI